MARLAFAAALSGLCWLGVVGCGSSVETAGAGGSGSTTATATSGAGGASATTTTSTGSGGVSSGDCDDDGECPGEKCVAVTPGGFMTCTQTPPEATQCHPAPAMDQCCSSADCKQGKCYETGLQSCGGPQPIASNACLIDQCQSDADCPVEANPPYEGVCVQPGVFGVPVKTCMVFGCKVAADCNAEPGGKCEPVTDPCCNHVRGLYCVYPNGGCRSNADCGADQHCEVKPDGSRAQCVAGPTACPA